MEEYKIFEIDDDVNDRVVFITSTEDLYYLQNDIYNELSKFYGDNFTVLVDLFLRNGFSFNRFVSLSYNGIDHCHSFIVNPREVSEEIKSKINNYLKKRTDLLINSALSQNIKNFIMST